MSPWSSSRERSRFDQEASEPLGVLRLRCGANLLQADRRHLRPDLRHPWRKCSRVAARYRLVTAPRPSGSLSGGRLFGRAAEAIGVRSDGRPSQQVPGSGHTPQRGSPRSVQFLTTSQPWEGVRLGLVKRLGARSLLWGGLPTPSRGCSRGSRETRADVSTAPVRES